jgi:DNA-directed RNA polymerase subunit beta
MPKKKDVTVSPEVAPTSKNVGQLYEIQGRYFFTHDKSTVDMPNLIEMQLDSYKDFLDRRLEKSFHEVFPITDFSGEKITIQYKSMSIDEPKYGIIDCKRKNLNFEAPLKVRLEMLNKETGEIKEQDVYMGGIPLMTNSGTFVINGIERVIVNQIVRSTGMFFSPDSKNPGSFTMKIVPHKGSWFEIELEKKGVINVKIDKKRKVPITVLLRAFGFENDADILKAF